MKRKLEEEREKELKTRRREKPKVSREEKEVEEPYIDLPSVQDSNL
jgi:hypothetical protein